jgi:hypothetical protein
MEESLWVANVSSSYPNESVIMRQNYYWNNRKSKNISKCEAKIM